ncbi:hypothetical protein [Nocardia pseudobrasiliensis]|uniref:PPE family protein n=1 Tax=Nocardia pseudobrasiliensis TaxID=45979 RepID=A0A370I1A8_9NOCA|nr:hypothetical protein [Nocardia pseudobrasiliensis]RDI64517.1 hypothetical protein DFR76_108350 [Nocardia pseudobrasiliensis]
MSGDDDKPDLGQVLSGYGSMGKGGKRLTLPDGKGNQLAGMVADILALVKDIRSDATSHNLANPTELSSLPSSKLLTEKFARRGKELDDILANQEKTLTDLGTAFVLVDKTYNGTDKDSGDKFKGLSGNASKYHINEKKFKYGDGRDRGPLGVDYGRNWQDPYLGDNPKTKDYKVEDKYLDKPPTADQISQYRQQGFQPDAVAISPEPGMSIGWKGEMKGFADSAFSSPAKNMYVAWTWCRLSTELTRAFGDLSQQMSALSKDWEGEGKEAAQAATANYAASTQPLTQYMNAVGQTLSWASGQLSKAASQVSSAVSNVDPAHPSSNGDTLDKVNDDAARSIAASYIDSLYAPMVTTASSALFSLPDPTKPLKAMPPGDPNNGNPNNGNPNNGNPNNGNPNNGNPNNGNPYSGNQNGGNQNGGNRNGGGNKQAHPSGSNNQQQPNGKQNQPDPEQTKEDKKYQQALNKERWEQLEQQKRDRERSEKLGKEQEAQQKKNEQYQLQQQQQQQKQQEQQAVQQAAQQGMQFLQQAVQQGVQAAQQFAGSEEAKKAFAGLPNLPQLPDPAELGDEVKAAIGGGGGGSGGGGGGIGGLKGLGDGPREVLQASRLFPRASAAEIEGIATSARSGVAAAGSGMGSPGGMGPMGHGAGQGQQGKEKKRADFLDSSEYLEEALGDAPIVAKPVVEQ